MRSSPKKGIRTRMGAATKLLFGIILSHEPTGVSPSTKTKIWTRVTGQLTPVRINTAKTKKTKTITNQRHLRILN